jgi:hypothetical protein
VPRFIASLRRLVVGFLVVGCASLLVGDVRSAGDPIEAMLLALGGRAAVRELKSLAVDANCWGPTGSFHTAVESQRPGRVRLRQSSERGSLTIWSTPERTWVVEGRGEPRSAGANERALARGHEFHLLLFEVESRFSNFMVIGDESVDGHPCTRVTMLDENGKPAAMLVDKEDSLPRVLELNPAGAQGPIRVFFADWRPEDALLYFWSFKLVEGRDRVFEYRYSNITPEGVAPSVFHEPEGRERSQPSPQD